jgi:glycosyltransferase involved in cell wall biosynthesis
MRIAFINWSARKFSGAEVYLDLVIPALARLGHQVALFCEYDQPADRRRIATPDCSPLWLVESDGAERALAEMQAWKPELLFSQGLTRPELELRTLAMAPALLLSHNYQGTCISGDKAFKLPTPRPCDRRFGWQCLLQFYPRRCGGLSPVTMSRLYRLNVTRQDVLRRYRMIMTISEHMRQEYLRHGFAPDAVRVVSSPIWSDEGESNGVGHGVSDGFDRRVPRTFDDEWRLLLAGRMVELKGGAVALAALPAVAHILDRRVRLIFAGDGPQRAAWEKAARRIERDNPRVAVEFNDWLDGPRFRALAATTHLVVMPSLWPEPFGLIGPEAGLSGVPSAAFAVGGIPEWLHDGVNGYLAPADPPTATGLAAAIVRCLRDPDEYAKLCSGALASARVFSVKEHIRRLTEIFSEVRDLRNDDAHPQPAVNTVD